MNSPRRRAKPLTFGGENRRIKLTALGESGVTCQFMILSPERVIYSALSELLTCVWIPTPSCTGGYSYLALSEPCQSILTFESYAHVITNNP